MNLLDLTPQQLKRAATVKEQIAALNKELTQLLGTSSDGAGPQSRRGMSAAAKSKIAAAQKARWAKLRSAKPAALPVKAAAKTKTMSPAARKKLSAKLKAYWKAKKAGKK